MDDTQKAVQRLKQGDISGLETIVMNYQVQAVRTAFLILQDEAAAQDVVQETFLNIYKHIRQYDENRPFAPFFIKSVVNSALNSVRRNTKSVSLDGDPTEIESLLNNIDSPEGQIEDGELSQKILSALAGLSPRQRAVIVQRYYLELSEREMSETLQTAPGTVKWLLHTARARLRDLLHSERSNQ
jgi:RNA polymerase sigma-70 factor (ECF subfamily)